MLRESLKADLNRAMMDKFRNDPEMASNPFSGMALAMIPAMINSMVDGFITPQAISRMATKGKMRDSGEEAADPANEPLVTREYVSLNGSETLFSNRTNRSRR